MKLFKKNRSLFAAVDHVSFGVEAQKCFGLLGLNGAGKTSTFKMIIGELNSNKGDVLVNGNSIKANRSLAKSSLGYCPQFDRLPDYMTVKETLYLYARLRGIESMRVEFVCRNMISLFQLNEFEHVLVQNLSGGNKRKLSCAVAFIGKPNVIILDEVNLLSFKRLLLYMIFKNYFLLITSLQREWIQEPENSCGI